MGLETVKEEILNSAMEQSSSIIADARKEASRLMKEAEKKVEEMKEKSETETKRTIEIIKRQELANAELENKKMLLEAKKEIIENVFSGAMEKLETLDDKKREAILKRLLEKAKGEIEIACIYCNIKDAKFLKGLNAEPIEITGGLIAENKENTIRIDYSFDTMLQAVKESELQNISKILFG